MKAGELSGAAKPLTVTSFANAALLIETRAVAKAVDVSSDDRALRDTNSAQTRDF